MRAPGVRAAYSARAAAVKEQMRVSVLPALTCYNSEVVGSAHGALRAGHASPLSHTRLLDMFMFVGKKTLHELSEFAFPILFPLFLY